jgi:hypothetical protein
MSLARVLRGVRKAGMSLALFWRGFQNCASNCAKFGGVFGAVTGAIWGALGFTATGLALKPHKPLFHPST